MSGNNEKVSPSEETTLTDELKKQIRSKFIGAVAAGVIAGAGSALALGITLFYKISGEVGLVPEGTVAAFDLKNGCPNGWKEYGPAYGRFILGANPDQRNDLAKREHGDIGGEEEVVLKEPQMPKHHHVVRNGGEQTAIKNVTLGGTYGVRTKNDEENTKTAGEGLPHENMPPFIVLQYCIKK